MSKSYRSSLQLCHAYVHKLTEAGRCDNTSYANNVFFSYSTPIAARIDDVILLTIESFSNTTAKHKHKLRSAASRVCAVISAAYIPTDLGNPKAISEIHKLNMDYFSNQLFAAMDTFLKTKRSRLGKARDLIKALGEIETYSNLFHLDWDNSPLIYQTVDIACFEVKAHSEQDGLGLDSGLKGEELAKAYREKVDESFRKWRSCATNKLPVNRLAEPIALRVTKDQIETSRAASMPKSNVAKLWPDLKAMWQSCFGADETVMAANPTLQFGQFRGVHVTKEFIRIGCHDIPWSEVVCVAKQLGLDVTGVENAIPSN